jgi:hypothetical protein
VAERSGDTAFVRTKFVVDSKTARPDESGVALRFPPHSKLITTSPQAMHNLHISQLVGQSCRFAHLSTHGDDGKSECHSKP